MGQRAVASGPHLAANSTAAHSGLAAGGSASEQRRLPVSVFAQQASKRRAAAYSGVATPMAPPLHEHGHSGTRLQAPAQELPLPGEQQPGVQAFGYRQQTSRHTPAAQAPDITMAAGSAGQISLGAGSPEVRQASAVATPKTPGCYMRSGGRPGAQRPRHALDADNGRSRTPPCRMPTQGIALGQQGTVHSTALSVHSGLQVVAPCAPAPHVLPSATLRAAAGDPPATDLGLNGLTIDTLRCMQGRYAARPVQMRPDSTPETPMPAEQATLLPKAESRHHGQQEAPGALQPARLSPRKGQDSGGALDALGAVPAPTASTRHERSARYNVDRCAAKQLSTWSSQAPHVRPRVPTPVSRPSLQQPPSDANGLIPDATPGSSSVQGSPDDPTTPVMTTVTSQFAGMRQQQQQQLQPPQQQPLQQPLANRSRPTWHPPLSPPPGDFGVTARADLKDECTDVQYLTPPGDYTTDLHHGGVDWLLPVTDRVEHNALAVKAEAHPHVALQATASAQPSESAAPESVTGGQALHSSKRVGANGAPPPAAVSGIAAAPDTPPPGYFGAPRWVRPIARDSASYTPEGHPLDRGPAVDDKVDDKVAQHLAANLEGMALPQGSALVGSVTLEPSARGDQAQAAVEKNTGAPQTGMPEASHSKASTTAEAREAKRPPPRPSRASWLVPRLSRYRGPGANGVKQDATRGTAPSPRAPSAALQAPRPTQPQLPQHCDVPTPLKRCPPAAAQGQPSAKKARSDGSLLEPRHNAEAGLPKPGTAASTPPNHELKAPWSDSVPLLQARPKAKAHAGDTATLSAAPSWARPQWKGGRPPPEFVQHGLPPKDIGAAIESELADQTLSPPGILEQLPASGSPAFDSPADTVGAAAQRPGRYLALLSNPAESLAEGFALEELGVQGDAVFKEWTKLGWRALLYVPSRQAWIFRTLAGLSEDHTRRIMARCASEVFLREQCDAAGAARKPGVAWFTTAACTCALTAGDKEVAAQPMPQWLRDTWTSLSFRVPVAYRGIAPNALRLELFSGPGASTGWRSGHDLIQAGQCSPPAILLALGMDSDVQFCLGDGEGKLRESPLLHGEVLSFLGLSTHRYRHRVRVTPRVHAGARTWLLTWHWVKHHSKVCRCPYAEEAPSGRQEGITALQPALAAAPAQKDVGAGGIDLSSALQHADARQPGASSHSRTKPASDLQLSLQLPQEVPPAPAAAKAPVFPSLSIGIAAQKAHVEGASQGASSNLPDRGSRVPQIDELDEARHKGQPGGDICESWLALGWEVWLGDGERNSWVFVKRAALSEAQASEAFQLCESEVPWSRPTGARGRPWPRQSAWLTDSPCTCYYRYGGQTLVPHPSPPWMGGLRHQVTSSMPAIEGGRVPNAVNCNLYEGHADSVGWHADDEPLFDAVQNWATIISLSLGESRLFQIRDAVGAIRSTTLNSGDILVMHGAVQKHFVHRVPPGEARSDGSRINLTWRWIRRHSHADRCPEVPGARAS